MKQKQTISIGMVKNDQQKFLISLRQAGTHLAGKWEFPGGKVETGESNESAMIRELKEEVALNTTEFSLFDSLDFQYDELDLTLHFYLVTGFTGEAIGLEGQELRWVAGEDLKQYAFPKANITVINKLLGLS